MMEVVVLVSLGLLVVLEVVSAGVTEDELDLFVSDGRKSRFQCLVVLSSTPSLKAPTKIMDIIIDRSV